MPKKDDSSDESGDGGGGADGGAPLPLPPAPGFLPLLAPVVLEERVPWHLTEWKRCFVTLDGARTKVWFDNCSGPGGLRRGWCNF